MIKRASQQQTLTLTPRKSRAHVANHGQVLHGHAADVVMDLRAHSAFDNPLHVDLRIEKGNIVRNRFGKELIILHHDTGRRPPE